MIFGNNPQKGDTSKVRKAKLYIHWSNQWYMNRTLDPKDRIIEPFSPRRYLFE